MNSAKQIIADYKTISYKNQDILKDSARKDMHKTIEENYNYIGIKMIFNIGNTTKVFQKTNNKKWTYQVITKNNTILHSEQNLATDSIKEQIIASIQQHIEYKNHQITKSKQRKTLKKTQKQNTKETMQKSTRTENPPSTRIRILYGYQYNTITHTIDKLRPSIITKYYYAQKQNTANTWAIYQKNNNETNYNETITGDMYDIVYELIRKNT